MEKSGPRDRESIDILAEEQRNEAVAKREYGIKKRSFAPKRPDQYCVIILIIQMREMGLRDCI